MTAAEVTPTTDTLAGENHSPTQKPDAGDHLGQHPGGVYPLTLEGCSQAHEQLGTQADEDAGADAGCLASQLALQPDDARRRGWRCRVETRTLGSRG